MNGKINTIVKFRQRTHGVERKEQITQGNPGAAAQRGNEFELDVLLAPYHPLTQYRLDPVTGYAAVKKELDDFNALPRINRNRVNDKIIPALDQIRLSRSGQRQQKTKCNSPAVHWATPPAVNPRCRLSLHVDKRIQHDNESLRVNTAPIRPHRHARACQVLSVDDHIGRSRNPKTARQLHRSLNLVADTK